MLGTNSSAVLCSMVVHTVSHSTEDVILNPDLFPHLRQGDFIQVFPYEGSIPLEKGRDRAKSSDTEVSDPSDNNRFNHIHNRLVFRVPQLTSTTGRLEISICKTAAEPLGFKPFSKVMVEHITEQEAELDFLELVFKRQYLQRGNMWRFKNQMFGRPVHLGQNIAINGMQAQIQELCVDTSSTSSGIITKKTKFVFRSRSSRIIWLVQISAEMWDFDRNGVLYFEKFLQDFVSPLSDSWKQLGVSHMLTVIFFSRTFYLERINSSLHPELYAKRSLSQNNDGLQFQDFYKIVIENATETDKVSLIRELRREFFAFPHNVGWKIAVEKPNLVPSEGNASHSSIPEEKNPVRFAVPSDAVNGNFLEAINTTLNLLDKHYMDRDLQRTGNSIVLISAGAGIFKVKPNLAQISKQRMLDGGIGIDFISLARPLVHAVPLFFVDCNKSHQVKDFYEMPHWIRISYIDFKKNSSPNQKAKEIDEDEADKEEGATLPLDRNRPAATLSASKDLDNEWETNGMIVQPASSRLTSILTHADDLKSLAADYTAALPTALKAIIARTAISPFAYSPRIYPKLEKELKSSVFALNEQESVVPIWGQVYPKKSPHGLLPNKISPLIMKKGLLLRTDLLCGERKEVIGAGKDNLNDLPMLKTDGDSMPGSLSSLASNDVEVRVLKSKAGGRIDEAEVHRKLSDYGGSSSNYVESISLSNSFVPKSFADSNIDMEREETTCQVTSSKHKVLKDINSLFSGTYLREDSEKSDREILTDLVDNFDRMVFRSSNRRSRTLQPAKKESNSGQTSSEESKSTTKDISKSHFNKEEQSSLNETMQSNRNSPIVSDNSAAVSKLNTSSSQSKVVRLSSKDFATKSPHQGAAGRGNRPGLGGSSSGGGGFMIVRGKVVPMSSAGRTSSVFGGGTATRGISRVEWVRLYSKKSHINPFKAKEGESYLRSLTHNRRRWSHVFPAGKNWKSLDYGSDFGLNWKSLTQPAILPIGLDYLPSVSDLKTQYEVQGHYSLINSDGNFLSQRDLINEIICQRLSQEYQLIDLPDLSAYLALLKNTNLGKKLNENDSFFVLSIGHRIQLLYYDRAQDEIFLSIYRSERGENSEETESVFSYKYEMWVPQLRQFQTVTQTFYQFPNPEFKWNQLDSVLAAVLTYGGLDDGTKPKRLRFSVIPDCRIETASDIDEYFTKIDQLLEFINKYGQGNAPSGVGSPGVGSGSGTSKEQIFLQKDRSSQPSYSTQAFGNRDYDIAKLILRGAKTGNPNWLYLKYDKKICSYKAYHMEFHWLVCDSWLIDEFITSLFRKSIKWGLRICQIPEYFCTGNLNVHPFRSMPRIPSSPIEHPALIRIIEHYYLTRKNGWLLDNEHWTDWAGMGLPQPNYEERDKEMLFNLAYEKSDEGTSAELSAEPSEAISSGGSSSSSRPLVSISQSIRKLGDNLFTSVKSSPFVSTTKPVQINKGNNSASNSSSNANASSNALPHFNTSDKRNMDRQYIHSSGLAAVRLAAKGFVWLLNSSARISDANISVEEKKDISMKKLRELDDYCTLVVHMRKLIWDIVITEFGD